MTDARGETIIIMPNITGRLLLRRPLLLQSLLFINISSDVGRRRGYAQKAGIESVRSCKTDVRKDKTGKVNTSGVTLRKSRRYRSAAMLRIACYHKRTSILSFCLVSGRILMMQRLGQRRGIHTLRNATSCVEIRGNYPRTCNPRCALTRGSELRNAHLQRHRVAPSGRFATNQMPRALERINGRPVKINLARWPISRGKSIL